MRWKNRSTFLALPVQLGIEVMFDLEIFLVRDANYCAVTFKVGTNFIATVGSARIFLSARSIPSSKSIATVLS